MDVHQYKNLHQIITIMNKLYRQALNKVVAELGPTSTQGLAFSDIMVAQGLKDLPQTVYHRINRDDLKGAVKIPCPVSNINTENDKLVIASAKMLRANFSIQQRKICNKCPHRSSCPQAGVTGQEKSTNAIASLLTFLQATVQQNQSNQNMGYDVYRSLYSGFKVCDSLVSVLKDLKNGGHEAMEFQRLRSEHLQENSEAKRILSQIKNLEKFEVKQTKFSDQQIIETGQTFGEEEKQSIYSQTQFEMEMSKKSHKLSGAQNRATLKQKIEPNGSQTFRNSFIFSEASTRSSLNSEQPRRNEL